MKQYSVDVEMEAPEGDSGDLMIRVDETLETTALIGPASAFNLRDNSISVLCQVEADTPTQAINLVVKHFGKALAYKPPEVDCKLVAVKCESYVDPELKELVSRAEIARRLKISEVRVHQLVRRKDFPTSVQQVDSNRPLFRWGDVLAWNKYRRANAKPGRPKKSAKKKPAVV